MKKAIQIQTYISGIVIGMMFFISDLLISSDPKLKNYQLLVDLFTMSAFVTLLILLIKLIAKEEDIQSRYGKIYIKGIKIGAIGVVVFFLLTSIMIVVQNMNEFGFIRSFMNGLPNTVGESFVRLFMVIIFSFVGIIYFFIKTKNTSDEILDDNYLNE